MIKLIKDLTLSEDVSIMFTKCGNCSNIKVRAAKYIKDQNATKFSEFCLTDEEQEDEDKIIICILEAISLLQ